MALVNLTRNLIVESAMEILRSFGLGDMTMRRVATHLGVAPGALYWHIANKQELVSAIAERILEPVLAAPAVPAADQPDPVAYCGQLREVLLSHRDGAEIVAGALAQPASPLRGALEHRLSEVLAALSADNRVATTGASAIVHLLLGACVQEQSRQQFAEVTGAVEASSTSDARAAIDEQVALLLTGITTTRP